MTNPAHPASTLWLRGTIERMLGRVSAARSSLSEGLRLFKLLQKLEEVKIIRRELALLAVQSNDLTAVREYLTVLHEAGGDYQFTPAL
jgi:hypothetical protein